MSDPKVVPLRPARCPQCGKPVAQDFRPFCSKRCADLDLGRWLDGGYRIPTDEGPGESEEGSGSERTGQEG